MTTPFRTYSKPSGDVMRLKASFEEEDRAHKARHDKIAALYVRQPRRAACKVCGAATPEAADFVSNGVPYAFCPVCGHLNGLHEDTEDFATALYADASMGYASPYAAVDETAFAARLDAIYRPKAAFLSEALDRSGLRARRVLDVGAGTGYFVRALRDAGFEASGVEPDPDQAADAARFVADGAVRRVALDETPRVIAQTDAEIVSFIGVLEHLRDPHACLAAAAENPNVAGVFLLVPMTGLSIYIENLFQEGFNRHLGGGHTHVFTERSLAFLRERHGFGPAAEWWFGSDAMDLRRHFRLGLAREGMTETGLADFADTLDPLLDQLQAVLDEARRCSEIHALWRTQN